VASCGALGAPCQSGGDCCSQALGGGNCGASCNFVNGNGTCVAL
jgi:hypothetical protein